MLYIKVNNLTAVLYVARYYIVITTNPIR